MWANFALWLNVDFISTIIPVCARYNPNACVHTSFAAFVRPGIEMKMLEMISRAQTSNARGRLSYDASNDSKNKAQRWFRGWKSW